jgi:hypothetical protein
MGYVVEWLAETKFSSIVDGDFRVWRLWLWAINRCSDSEVSGPFRETALFV